jgi:peptidoglycan/LPS O-acetylase OafA/YrhL
VTCGIDAYHYAGFLALNRVDRVANALSEFGWVGVDLFFVLSGFLITGILFDSKTDDHYYGVFYTRRILRIFPVYYLFLLLLTVFSVWIAPHRPESHDLLHSWPWYWLFGVNFLTASRGGFGSMPFGTGILWSLAIEEQFYLLWPLLVLKLGRVSLMRLCALLLAASMLLRIYLRFHDVNPAAIYTLTPTRMDGLAAGAFAALLLRGPVRAEALGRYVRGAVWLGAALIGISLFEDRTTNPYGAMMQRVGYSGVALAAVGMVLAPYLLAAGGVLRTVLRSRILRLFGRYSYALYLVHFVVREIVFPLFPPLESLPGGGGLQLPWVLLRAACTLAVALFIAWGSWQLVEKRFLALKKFISYGRPGRGAGATPAPPPVS